MAGVQVGKRIIGADAPVTVGWENIGKVEGGPFKQLDTSKNLLFSA